MASEIIVGIGILGLIGAGGYYLKTQIIDPKKNKSPLKKAPINRPRGILIDQNRGFFQEIISIRQINDDDFLIQLADGREIPYIDELIVFKNKKEILIGDRAIVDYAPDQKINDIGKQPLGKTISENKTSTDILLKTVSNFGRKAELDIATMKEQNLIHMNDMKALTGKKVSDNDD